MSCCTETYESPKMSTNLRVTSWNINGAVSVKLPVIQTLCDTNDVLCLQERLLTADSLCLLSKTASTVVISRAARHSGAGRPSGGTAILARNVLMPEHFRNSDYFTAVKIQNYVVACMWPTTYVVARIIYMDSMYIL